MRKGVLCILLSAFGFALMAMFVRLADGCGGVPLPAAQKAFFRNFFAAIIAAFLFFRSKTGVKGMTPSKVLHLFLRCAAGTAGIICNFWCLDHMNISDATMLNKLGPFFVVIFSIYILKESIHGIEIISAPGKCRAATFSRISVIWIAVREPLKESGANKSFMVITSN